jgi:uncharacterized membrane protein (UPF0127 family)
MQIHRFWRPSSVLLFAVGLLLLNALPFGSRSGAVVAQEVSACDFSDSAGSTLDADPTLPQIVFLNSCGQRIPFAVTVAANPQQWERGLMEVSPLPADQGELFDFIPLAGGNEVQVPFWMEDTPIPLSIAFIGRDGSVHEIQDMQAESTDFHIPRAPYLYAVETNLGWFAMHNINPGAPADLSAALLLAGQQTSP